MSSTNQTILLHEVSKLRSKHAQWEPFAWYKEMREKNPVYYDAEQEVWNVFLYDHCKRVLFDYQLFSSKKERTFNPVPIDKSNRINLTSYDPPEHKKRRALLAQAFTPQSLKEWKPKIQAIADELIKDLEGQATVDIVQQLAIPLPVIIIASLLGVPPKDRELIKSWSDILFYPYNKETYNDIVQQKALAMKEFHEYLYPIVQEKRRHPSDDIISDLTKAKLEGDQLTDAEVVMSSIGLLGAGNETTTMLISNMFYSMLFDQPGVYQEIRADFSLVPKLTEEVLRFRFPITQDRQVAQDTTIFGHEMKKGQIILAWTGAANRDESQFAHAEDFDIHRQNNQQHLTFGAGPHFCLGAPLARMEADIALTAFVKRFAHIDLVEGFEITEHLIDSAVGQSLKSFPIRLKKDKQ